MAGGFDRALGPREMRSIHAGNHAGCCASRVEIERRLESDRRGATEMSNSESRRKEYSLRAPAFTRNRLGQGRVYIYIYRDEIEYAMSDDKKKSLKIRALVES